MAIALSIVTIMAGAATGGNAVGASSNSTVSVTVASATNIDASGCATGTPNVTDLGTMLPNQSNVTSSDCNIIFGSSNDTSMLRAAQSDGIDNALWNPTNDTLDTGFSGDGKTTTAVGAGDDVGSGVVVQSDGKIVVAGYTHNGTNNDILVLRYTTAGALDTTFDTDGIVTINSGSGDAANAVRMQPDGKIVIAGNYGSDNAIIRLAANGSLDTTFGGGDGIATVTQHFGATMVDVAVASDGTIVAAGYGYFGAPVEGAAIIIKVTASGIPDTSFDSDGIVSYQTVDPSVTSAGAVAIDSAGRIIIAGQTDPATPLFEDYIARFTPAGALDTTFDTDGVKKAFLGDFFAAGHDIHVLTGDKLLISGTRNDLVSQNFRLGRLNANGSPDVTFSPDGLRSFNLGGQDRIMNSIVQPDGRIISVGQVGMAGPDVWGVSRLTPAGVQDTSFSDDGWMTYSIGSVEDVMFGGAVGPDGEVVTVGQSDTGTNDDVAVSVLATERVADYANGSTDWDQGSNTFGACLRTVSGGASSQWTTSATCPATDGAYWNSLPTTSTKIAYTTTAGTSSVTASLRFGMRTSLTQHPGTYMAPITFDVVAPNV